MTYQHKYGINVVWVHFGENESKKYVEYGVLIAV
jgi:hypothetical protein